MGLTSRLLNLATLLSLAVSFASIAMWARSQFLVEGWERSPYPSGMIYRGSGWHEGWAVESAGGRLIYVKFKIFVYATDAPLVGGYQRHKEPLTPIWTSRRFPKYPRFVVPKHDSWRVPGVAEWFVIREFIFKPPGQYFAVSWLAVAAAAAALPCGRVCLRLWRRWRTTRPAFPVVPLPGHATEANA